VYNHGNEQSQIDKLISDVIIKMSQRLGMADGRCFTVNSSSQLYNNYLMNKNGISYEDNYSFRQLLQSKGPQLFNDKQSMTKCASCDEPLVNTRNIY
jgi:hypothetical protein